MSDMSTFDQLVADLTRDVRRVQPNDALQFCARWFQSRLEEQRARARDVLGRHPSLSGSLPRDHYFDTPLSPTETNVNHVSVSPFALSSYSPRPHVPTMANPSPFGTLNVPGNALLSDSSTQGRRTPVNNPSFQFDGEMTPISNPNPFGSFADGWSGHDSGDTLHAPSETILARRTSVSAESILVDGPSDVVIPVYPKSDDQMRRIRASIANCLLFRELDEEQETGVVNAMQERHFSPGEVVIRQGEDGDYFYAVESGLLHCFLYPPGPLPTDWTSGNPAPRFNEEGYHPVWGKKVTDYTKGTSFGEVALMYNHQRLATIVAIEPSTLWSLDRMTFRTIVLKAAHRRRTMYENFLSSVDLLASLEPLERSKVADVLVSRVYEDGEDVVQQGEMGDSFFFVEDGTAIVTKTTGRSTEQVSTLTKGDYFGELSLLRLEPRAATVSAKVRTDPTEARLKVAALDANAFKRLLGPLRELMERNAGARYGVRPRSSR